MRLNPLISPDFVPTPGITMEPMENYFDQHPDLRSLSQNLGGAAASAKIHTLQLPGTTLLDGGSPRALALNLLTHSPCKPSPPAHHSPWVGPLVHPDAMRPSPTSTPKHSDSDRRGRALGSRRRHAHQKPPPLRDGLPHA
ncbi:hypothetical protein C8R44DRAFT_740328 [Mycena epipterygia]|nr:hypothetical protein C8R44DRAFT_740328 [Mycena epipterygia]